MNFVKFYRNMDSNSIEAAMKYIANMEHSTVRTHVIARGEQYKVSYARLPVSVITNSMDRSHKGKHWLLWNVYKTTMSNTIQVDFFCSYGLSPFTYKLDFPRINSPYNL